MPVETDRVAHSASDDFVSAAVDLDAAYEGVTLWIRCANVARRPNRDIKHAVGSEPDEFPAVMPVAGKPIRDHRRRLRLVQPRLDVVKAQDPVHLRDVKGSAFEGHAVGRV